MDTRDMSIMSLEEMEKKLEQKPEDRKWFKEIPAQMAETMKFMNRHERRKYFKLHKHELQKGNRC